MSKNTFLTTGLPACEVVVVKVMRPFSHCMFSRYAAQDSRIRLRNRIYFRSYYLKGNHYLSLMSEPDSKRHKLSGPIQLGATNFADIARYNFRFIDKTMFIKEFMDSMYMIDCILRPRRFGKTLDLSMLRCFLSFKYSTDFSKYKINEYPDFVQEHLHKYPVLYLDLKDCKQDTWDLTLRRIWACIKNMVREHAEDLKESFDLSVFDLDNLQTVLPDDENFILSSLRVVTELLFKTHKEQVVVLIDEYDAAMNNAYKLGFYHEASKFCASFYSSALKSYNCLKKACFMGIVEISGKGSSMSSILNNVGVSCTVDDNFSSSFGFTVEEIKEFFNSGIEIDQILLWYNGYTIGSKTQVINPWSLEVIGLKLKILKILLGV